jgi:glycosyltransferase involved in cell wall biosynthesis
MRVQYTTVARSQPYKRKEYMNIVVISTDSLLTPPTAYGGIELQAWLIVKGLSGRGHHVHLIAKEGSSAPPNGNLYPYAGNHELAQAIDMISSERSIDCWIDETHDKLLTKWHPELPQITRYEVMSLMGDPRCPVLISKGQRDEKFGGADWPIVYQSIDLDVLPLYGGERDNYLLYMGQKIPEKRVGWACEVAVRSNIPLYIHGPGWNVDPVIEEYAVKYPALIHNEGEVGGWEKVQKLQGAKALLHFPGARGWCEAGGIVVLEALAVGTLCLVSRNGCLLEYIQPGANGYVVDSIEEAVDALSRIDRIRPEDCRKSVERFDYRKNAVEIEALCQRVARGERWR